MKEDQKELVQKGYEKLAFGSVTDAVRLLFEPEPTLAALKKMDLFNISEVRKGKDGALQIKFYSRLEALQRLEELQKKEGKESPFYQALEESVKALQGTDHEV